MTTNLSRARLVRQLWVFMLVTGALRAFAMQEERPLSATPDSHGEGRIVIDVHGTAATVPTVFTAEVEQTVLINREELTGEAKLKLTVIEGKSETFTLSLSGEGEVVNVSGLDLQDWSVRQGTGANATERFLDLRRTANPTGSSGARSLEWVVRTRSTKFKVPARASVLTLGPGKAVGFSSRLTLRSEEKVAFKVLDSDGFLATESQLREPGLARFVSGGNARMVLALLESAAVLPEVELIGVQLAGRMTAEGRSAEFTLTGKLRSKTVGARTKILLGKAALIDRAEGDGWHAELIGSEATEPSYDLVADRLGDIPLALRFAAEVVETKGWKTFDFSMPAGAVVPLTIANLGHDITFKSEAPIVPILDGEVWKGFLPANGSAGLWWKYGRAAEQGPLFFTSEQKVEMRVGSGLIQETAQIKLRVLQGDLNSVRLRVEGAGEILSVTGTHLVEWKVLNENEKRVLLITFSRPVRAAGTLTIASQTELKENQNRTDPLRFAPQGAIRDSGFLRLRNEGPVRIEVMDTTGLSQLAPKEFPGSKEEPVNGQVLVYRFPTDQFSLTLTAQQIQPEVGVSELTVYQMEDTDRVVATDIELEIREAALHEWSFQIPEAYNVTALKGEAVADYTLENAGKDGERKIRVIFRKLVEGRQLLQLRLEKNQPAASGEWILPVLHFPGAKSLRGNIGVVATPGFRVVPGQFSQLTEIPVSYFPQDTAGLQQSWRIKSTDWSAAVRMEAIAQSVQADVFHLYSVKQGVVFGSVLLNYFVVGAPATEWKIHVPSSLGNVDVTGQSVGKDWRREGDEVIVSLHQPVLGAETVLITFEEPIGAKGAQINPGEVRPLGVQSERGFIQVVSPLQVEPSVKAVKGTSLTAIDPLELPAEFRLLTNSPALATYQYTDRPFELELNLSWSALADTTDQVVDFAGLSSVISRDGQVVTDAEYFVKTRGAMALRFTLPKGAKLWETHVNGELATARIDGAETVIPLPAQANPNQPVTVQIRMGQEANGAGQKIALVAPRMAATIVTTQWILKADSGRVLLPRGGTAALSRARWDETGFEWISAHALSRVAWLMVALVLGTLCFQRPDSWRTLTGMSLCAIALAQAGWLMAKANTSRQTNASELTYTFALAPEGRTVSVEVDNVLATESGRALAGWGAVVSGLALCALGVGLKRAKPGWKKLYVGVGIAATVWGCLVQPHGAVYFFALMGGGAISLLAMGGFDGWERPRRGPDREPPAGGTTGPARRIVLGIAIGLTGCVLASPRPAAAEDIAVIQPWKEDGAKSAEAIKQHWEIRGDRVFGEIEVTARGEVGDSFLVLRSPAILLDCRSDGLRLGKSIRDGEAAYFLSPEKAGVFTAQLRFEMPLGERNQPITLPTGPAAIEQLTVLLDQPGWDIISPAAVQILATAGLDAQHSGATLTFAPQAVFAIKLQPKQRDPAAEPSRFFVEAANLYWPRPGVVNGRTRFTVRPVQGRVADVTVAVPVGMTVTEVVGKHLGLWRFDPQTRKLHAAVEPMQSDSFTFEVGVELGTGTLPFDLSIEPLRVDGAAGDVGTIALAFAGDAQAQSIRSQGLAAVSVAEFDPALLPPKPHGGGGPTIENVWRYGQSGGQIKLRVAAVEPDVRVTSREVISLDDDRLVMAVDLDVTIARAGIFQLSFPLPEGLDVDAISGSALSEWTESNKAEPRLVVLHLSGQTIGKQRFSLTFAGAAPHAQTAWTAPRLAIREATRQVGEVIFVPGKGIRLRAVEREQAVPLDPRELGGFVPGTLAFRFLQGDWSLRLAIEALEPWVTVQALEDVTMREGQTLTRIALLCRVDNAGVKQLEIKLPGLSEETKRTVRATGSAIKDFLQRPGKSDIWQLEFRRAIAGETEVQIEFQDRSGRAQDVQSVSTPVFINARQVTQFVVVRGSGRLELAAVDLPQGWARIDWPAVPLRLQDQNDRSIPTLCYRATETENSLRVSVRRNEVADALKLQVTRAELVTLLSTENGSLTSVDLLVDVMEKTRLRIELPKDAALFNASVNGETVDAVHAGGFYSFHVAAERVGQRTARVHFVYANSGDAKNNPLMGPVLSVPLQNVTWQIVVPMGSRLRRYEGDLELREVKQAKRFDLQDYQELAAKVRRTEAKTGVALLAAAGDLLEKGDQQKASEMLSRASNLPGLDEASNEDARVQLRKLKTEQTVLGLNTRRQRLYLDNRLEATRNEQLELAADLNPFMRGALNFDPQQMDQLLAGNTVEENSALKGIAARLVDQQFEAAPAAAQLALEVPTQGTILTFARTMQVNGAAPLTLELSIEKIRRVRWAAVVWPLFGSLLVGAILITPKRKKD